MPTARGRRHSDGDARERNSGPVARHFPAITVEDSYAISTEVAQRKIKAGAKLIGHKVGLTSKAMQRSSMIDEPDYGYILDDQMIADGAKVSTRISASRGSRSNSPSSLASDCRGRVLA